jgi:hypothetical protein
MTDIPTDMRRRCGHKAIEKDRNTYGDEMDRTELEQERDGGAVVMTSGELGTQTVQVLQNDLEYRRKKQWDIFTWSSTVLLSIVGGMFVLERQGGTLTRPWEKLVVSLAALTVASFAQLWIRYHWKHELGLCDVLGKHIGFSIMLKKPLIGYPHTLGALTMAALLAIWCPALKPNKATCVSGEASYGIKVTACLLPSL